MKRGDKEGANHALAATRPAMSIVVAGLFALLLACGGDDGPSVQIAEPAEAVAGTARTYLLGISAQPAVPAEYSYRDTFGIAAQAGEVVLIQRQPPWEDFLPGGTVSSRTEQLTVLEEELAEEHNLRLFLAIDPTQPGDRGQLAGLPKDLAGVGFDDPDVRAAFVAYAKYLALNYKPAYLALGVEVDMVYAAQGEAAFDAFVSLYFEAYDAVKSVSQETLVFPTFQYEDMLGILHSRGSQLPSWELLQRFEPRIDLLAVSSYPGLVFNGVAELPQGYYFELANKLDRPVALVSVGWNSDDSARGERGESAQVTYLYRLLAAADELKAELVVWHLARDPEVVPGGFEPLAHMGLHDVQGRPKQGWRVWLAAKARPAPGLP